MVLSDKILQEEDRIFDPFAPEVTELGIFPEEEADEEISSPLSGEGKILLSPQESLYRSLSMRGKIDLPYMSGISGYTVEELIRLLAGKQMWQDPYEYSLCPSPETGWKTMQVYLNGQNGYRLLKEAEEAQDRYGIFEENIRLIQSHMDLMLSPAEVYIPLGAPWIPEKYVQEFLRVLLDYPMGKEVVHIDTIGKWRFDKKILTSSVKNNYTYGIHELPALSIIEKTLNCQRIEVLDHIVTGEGEDYVPNKEKTLAAQDKQRLIQAEWDRWIHEDEERAATLRDLYCEKFGFIVVGYDGNHLALEDMNPAVQLYPHQRNAVARAILSHNTLLAHSVGSGKTYIMAATVHEWYRMGLSLRNMIVAPSEHVLEASVNSHLELFPMDRLLVIRPRDFTKTRRQNWLSRIRDEEYTAVYMAASSFDLIGMSRSYYLTQKEKEIRRCRAAENEASSGMEKNELQNSRKVLEKQLEKMQRELLPDKFLTFEELGISGLVIDESHIYKNISLGNISDNIVGLHNRGSKKADQALEKVHFTQESGGRILFATGTPLVNSLTDLYVLQRFLQPKELERCGIYRFQEWANTFCERENHFEIDVDSQNFRFINRISKFKNLPELMGLISSFCDYYFTDEELNLPVFHGYSNIALDCSGEQKAYIASLADRVDAIRAKAVGRSEDNLLKCTVDGRKCALDVRLVKPEAESFKGDKVSACAAQAASVYRQFPGATQIIFCDTSTPKESFNMYDEAKAHLIRLGVPEKDLAYIHDAATSGKKDRMLEDFNQGRIRILIGSTAKLGVGFNVQERLVAIHHLDVPWRPADMIQREGRLIRPGNLNKEVFIYRYVTRGSFDGYIYQLLESKQRFISAFLAGSMDPAHREESDVGEAVLDYAEVKALATGNPLIRKRIELSNELERLRISQRTRREELEKLRLLSLSLPRRAAKLRQELNVIRQDDAHYKRCRESVPLSERKAFGEELLLSLKEHIERPDQLVFDQYQGFSVLLPAGMEPEKPYVLLFCSKTGSSYPVSMEKAGAVGCSRRLDQTLGGLGEQAVRLAQTIERTENQVRDAQAELAQGNPYDQKVEEIFAELNKVDESMLQGQQTTK